MSLKKKIILGFLVSSFLIAILSVFLYLNFIEITKETVFLELTDTIRSKTLQLRRHEKNYFLYAPEKADEESKAIYQYLSELDAILKAMTPDGVARTSSLRGLLDEYSLQFRNIERLLNAVSAQSEHLKSTSSAYSRVSGLISANFLDKPLEDIRYLEEAFSMRSDDQLILQLKELDVEITALRKTGENMLAVSKELDKTARENVESFIHSSRVAILVISPIFLIVGFGTTLFIVSGVVRRLHLLTGLIEKTGRGNFEHVSEPVDGWGSDEVGQLILKFNQMETQLELREKELLQSRKLAAIGTLAAGVAHELNNPLNNIYTTAQRLRKKTGAEGPDFITRGLDDIFGQSMRVKRIVSDLLSFARGRDPHPRPVELMSFIQGVYKQVANSIDVKQVSFGLQLMPQEIVIYADPEQLEQVFVNLFSNAVESMTGSGSLSVGAVEEDHHVVITVSDTGPGMPRETAEKIFEPFFSTKEKGTGLGLAIVFNIIKRHRGEIAVSSIEGKGTSFIITLPKILPAGSDKEAVSAGDGRAGA
ncbi:MAG: HAMP domain-containing protein [Nitrospirae bacterium]|nr:HAMP domain-containing protein [Nitrospirota bacterium]MBI5739553.1 HAMP domain-containing protein [Nitrospirota bacterium]